MKVESVDFYYLSMPKILDIGDGSQDVLLVRVRSGEWEGWGECDASPLVSIASLISPMSHSACKPVIDSVLGQALDSPADIARIGHLVRANSFDQLQSAHTFSGIDIAMWDLLGRRYQTPVYELLGFPKAFPKRPYASILFGETPEETYLAGREMVCQGFSAVKFGWSGFGAGSVEADVAQLEAAREGVGEADLLIDVAMEWGTDVGAATARVPFLEKYGVLFVEEPFLPGADSAYRTLKRGMTNVKVAGGEGCHNVEMALGMLEHSNIDYLQIDTGRIGGITPANVVADAADERGRTYLNHTFTSHLALSASLQPFAGRRRSSLCEYPVMPKPVSMDLTSNHLVPDTDGMIRVPDAPGLGMDICMDTVEKYLVETEIRVGGRILYRSPLVALESNSRE